jgi:serine/threonine protein kinase
MANTQAEIDEAFLNFVAERGHVSALEAESLRSELRRRRATQKGLTMQGLLVHKGFLTEDHADKLYSQMMNVLSEPTLVPQSDFTEPQQDETDRAARKDTQRRPTRPVADSAHPTDKRPTDRPGTGAVQRATTRPVDDSRPGTDRSTTSRKTDRRDDGWNLHRDTDALAATDKLVPAGTVIHASEMTVAMMRQKIGIKDEGVKLLSDKMQSSLAQYQPDATQDRKRYVVVKEIARGGMGKVLEVEDTELRRSVALKVLRKELLGRRDVVERFLEEAQITGQLEHPNIVPVHEMGVDGAGNLYFTMKLVEGASLAEVLLRLREGNRDALNEYPLLRLLDVFIKICEGMSFAHNRGVIHRDLKPANIMVGRFGEVQVMDWGVAKVVGRQFRSSDNDSGIVLTDRLDAGAAHTMMGSIIGTPSYMSPEQAKGEIDTINHESDIFSLGVILYEMLCLRSPWTGKSSDEVLEQVREMTPMKPRERNPDVEIPTELERLALKCLEKDPDRRIDTVKELAENVRNFIEGRAMGSVEYSPFRLAAKWVGRNKKEVFGTLLALIAVVAGILGTLWYLQKIDRDKVFGLNDDATVIMQEWEPLAQEGSFDDAEGRVDQARTWFQQVLAVDENDETALAGIDEVRQAYDQIRRMRIEAAQTQALKEQRDKLVNRAQDLMEAGRTDTLYLRDNFQSAFETAGLVLVQDPKDPDALLVRAQAANGLAKYWSTQEEWGLVEYWVEELRETGLLPRELKDRQFQLQLKLRSLND